MQNLLNELENHKNWKDMLRATCKMNDITTALSSQLTILRTRSLYKRFQRSYEKEVEKQAYTWAQNELKTYHWILMCVSALTKRKVLDFTEAQWRLFGEIFRHKERSVLEYEACKLLKKKVKKIVAWESSEEQLLLKLIKHPIDDRKWNEVGRSLFWESDKKYFRTGKQCRERWMNHLDPKKIHGCWRVQEDLQLLELADSENRKWAKIVKQFNGERTEHMIKNRFKSLITRQKKLQPQLRRESKIIEAIKARLRKQDTKRRQSQSQSEADASNENQNSENEICEKISQKKGLIEEEVDSPVPKEEGEYSRSQRNQCLEGRGSPIKEHNQMEEQIPVKVQNWEPREDEREATEQKKSSSGFGSKIGEILEEAPEQPSQSGFGMNGFRVYSPYCMGYPMASNLTPTGLTPTGLTPTYFSPPAFYVNNFTQNMMSFQMCLNAENSNEGGSKPQEN